MSRKKSYSPPHYAAICAAQNRYAPVYESQITAPAFCALSKNSRLLYLMMRLELFAHSGKRPQDVYPEIPEFQHEEVFFFPFSVAVNKYRLYTGGNKKQFYADLHALEKHGFIDVIANGKPNKKKSVYRFSQAWKDWNG